MRFGRVNIGGCSKSNFRTEGEERGPGEIIRLSLITKDGVTVAKEIELEDPFPEHGERW